jgi:hypothetical protein
MNTSLTVPVSAELPPSLVLEHVARAAEPVAARRSFRATAISAAELPLPVECIGLEDGGAALGLDPGDLRPRWLAL